jgi:hypothetical protein
MTKEQLDRYEELSDAVELAHELLTAAMLQLAIVRPGNVEKPIAYLHRMDSCFREGAYWRKRLAEAKAAKKAFIASLVVLDNFNGGAVS